jgi:spore germination protein GerM
MAVKKSSKKGFPVRKSVPQSRNMVPIYVLTIMALSAALIAVLNVRNADKTVKVTSSASTGDIISNAVPGNGKAVAASPSSGVMKPSPSPTAGAFVEPTEKKVKAFFMMYNEKNSKIIPVFAVREIKSFDELSAALRETIKGPSDSEEKKGFVSALPKNVKVRKTLIQNTIADIDLSKEFADGIQGDAVAARVNQIYYTAMQFPGVKGILIRINGKPIKTLGPDGLIINWPMKRSM